MVEIQCLLDNVGTSELVIDLIVNTKNDRVFEESILLGIALLQGGNTQIQVRATDTQILYFSPHLPAKPRTHACVLFFRYLNLSPFCLPHRTHSTASCTSRRSLRGSSRFSTTACVWPSKRSEPPCPSTCLSSAAEKGMTTVTSVASGSRKVQMSNDAFEPFSVLKLLPTHCGCLEHGANHCVKM